MPFASARSAGIEVGRADRPRPHGGPRPERLRHRAVLGRRRHLARVGAQVRRRRRDRDRQLLGVPPRSRRAAGRLRGQPARARAPPRPDRQPQLLDDADGRGAGADPPGGGDRAARRLHLPVRLRHRQGGRRRARRPGPRLAARDGDARAGDLSRADRVQRDRRRRELRRGRRPHRRGAQDDVRDAQDPRGRVDRRRRHLRPGAGARLPLGVGQRPDARADLGRGGPRAAQRRPRDRARANYRPRSRPPTATRCSSAASAATSRTRARSACGSSATTSARGPRRTRSRSPSCSSAPGRPRRSPDVD